MTYQSSVFTGGNSCGDLLIADKTNGDRFQNLLDAYKRKCTAGTMLVLEGEVCQFTYVVQSGWLAVAKTTENGDRQILDFALPGDIIDLPRILRQNSPVQVEALTFAKIAAIPARIWDQAQIDDRDIAELNSRYTVALLGRFAHGMLRLGKGRAETRLAFVLMELCVRLRAIGQFGNQKFHVPITQQQLGDFAGMSAVHVCRMLQRLQKKGIVAVEGHTDVVIRDMDALAAVSGIGPDDLAKEVVPNALGG